MTLDDQTGLVKWTHASAQTDVYTVGVKAVNLVGEDSISWNISVPLSYNVSVGGLDLKDGILPVPKQVGIYGKISFTNNDMIRIVPIDIR